MLRPNWLHILVALARSDLHGSAIADDVLEQTDGALRLWPATLYRTLEEMVGEGIIEELTGARRPEGESQRRKFYGVNAQGRRALSAEVERLAELADTARARLGEEM